MGAAVPLRRRGGHELAGRAVKIQQILSSTHRRIIPRWACGEQSDASVREIMLGKKTDTSIGWEVITLDKR